MCVCLQVASLEWCKGPEIGLPAPDAVFYLSLSPEAAKERSEYGSERYENTEFQAKVEEQFKAMSESNWRVINASETVDSIHQEVLESALRVIRDSADQQIQPLWDHNQ